MEGMKTTIGYLQETGFYKHFSNLNSLGHDTTTSGISWILYELAKNQSYQKLCQQEVDKVLRDSNGFVTWYDLTVTR